MVLQIFHSSFISLLRNDIAPFTLIVIPVWNRCILASNRCILTSFSPLDALMFRFYLMESFCQGFSCGWRLRKNILLKALIFAWAMDQSTGPSGHDSGGGEFTIGNSIKWHIICANRIWWIDGLILLIEQQFQRRRINSDILLLWQLLCENQRWCSDEVVSIY